MRKNLFFQTKVEDLINSGDLNSANNMIAMALVKKGDDKRIRHLQEKLLKARKTKK